jgi:hypothetical protein
MFGYLLKNLPSEYLYAGYLVRKGLSSSTIEVDGNSMYDAYLYTYLENNLTLLLQMEDGTYKDIASGLKLPEIMEDDIVSQHLERAEFIDMADYGEYNKKNPIAVYGLHTFETMIKLENADASIEEQGLKVGALKTMGVKRSYSGMEALAVVGRFNTRNKLDSKQFCVPAIKKDANDAIDSAIGDINNYHELIKDKDPDQIVQILYNISKELDSVGNKKYESLGL